MDQFYPPDSQMQPPEDRSQGLFLWRLQPSNSTRCGKHNLNELVLFVCRQQKIQQKSLK